MSHTEDGRTPHERDLDDELDLEDAILYDLDWADGYDPNEPWMEEDPRETTEQDNGS
jgi:hypothetical protein